jgi:hypothetical protein
VRLEGIIVNHDDAPDAGQRKTLRKVLTQSPRADNERFGCEQHFGVVACDARPRMLVELVTAFSGHP